MCKRCVELVEQYFPGLSQEDRGTLLWSCTAFPMCEPEYLEGQLVEIVERRRRDGNREDWLDREAAYAWADMELATLMTEDW